MGIIGAGSIAADIALSPSIEALPNAYLAALCDTTIDRIFGQDVPQMESKETYVDYHDMLEVTRMSCGG